METFISNHWPFLIAPVYVLAGVVNCWVTHLFFKNNPKIYEWLIDDGNRYTYKPPYSKLSTGFKVFEFTIGLVIIPLFLIGVYTGRMINKLLP